jgi:SAM-dependent methyltransferase
MGRPIRRALVLGAGTGNDVAVLLNLGAEHVDAVEIDPGILQLGREIHPNHPYDDPRVTVHNTDARSFLNETKETFDVIAFGTLDSMTRLSALSNVRLDNFVYTRECLAAARDRLTPDGGLIMYFMVGQEFISDHLTALLAGTFGHLPEIHRGDYSLFNTVFMAGPAFEDAGAPPDPDAWYLKEDVIRQVAPSDDWPYLYLPGHQLTAFYISMMAVLAGIAVLAILVASPEMRRALDTRGEGGPDFEMFLYGFAFLLIETKFVTAMNLLWGATWITSAVVFGSILAVILVGTVLTETKSVPWQRAALGLVAALLVVYFLPLRLLLTTSPEVRLGLSALLVGLPVLFASMCFAARFRARPAADIAFGWNLLGAVLGGLAEFLSMVFGFRTLTLVALAAYLGAFAVARAASKKPEALATNPR